MATNVFLSHSSKDAAFTSRLEADLRAAGAQVYRVSADLPGNFPKRINDALSACEWVVLVLTKDSLASGWVDDEVNAAIVFKHHGRIKDILPIQAGPLDYKTIPALWGIYNIFDASHDYPTARDALLRALGLPTRNERSVASEKPNTVERVTQQAVPPKQSPAIQPPSSRALAPRPAPVVVATQPQTAERLPAPLAELGFGAHKSGAVEYILPPLCAVPAGTATGFLMGSDPRRDGDAYANETPQSRVPLSGFQIARFPVTVAEYACFVRSGQTPPADWQIQLGMLDHPVVSVSWYDAAAYAAWLSKVSGHSWRLPSEAEWEKAARGEDGRIYPWGDQFEAGRCNTVEGGQRTTTPVGTYPGGASPCGAQDMAGNVWEWTSSLLMPYPYSPGDGREAPDAKRSRVLRGGSWFGSGRLARAANRDDDQPNIAIDNSGFRLVRESVRA